MKKKYIKIAEEFTRFPSGRYKTDGEYSGERFREEFLIPSLKDHEKVVVNINGVRGYGSSFLEEAFGGIVREGHYTENQLKERLEIDCDEQRQTYSTEIWRYIEEASR